MLYNQPEHHDFPNRGELHAASLEEETGFRRFAYRYRADTANPQAVLDPDPSTIILAEA